MEQVLERCAGLDVHTKRVAVCVRVPGVIGDRAQHVRTFGTTTAELLTLHLGDRDTRQGDLVPVGWPDSGPQGPRPRAPRPTRGFMPPTR